MTVRPAEDRDLDDLLALGALFYGESPACAGLAYDPEAVLQTIRESMELGGAFVLENGLGQVVGGALGRLGPTWFGGDFVASAWALYVLPEGRGHGWRLVQALAAWAHECGAARLTLEVNSGVTDDRTWALLERLDWRVVGGSTMFDRAT